MPTKVKDRTDDAAPAVAEADAGPRMLSVEFAGHSYEFKAKRLDSVQFRLLMQKDRVVPAVEFLLGTTQFAAFMSRSADEDGDTELTVFYDLVEKIGEAVGAGNS
jgi:hypothetical protein